MGCPLGRTAPSAMRRLLPYLTLLALVFPMATCTDKTVEEEHTLLPDSCHLRAGDLVFRRGTGLTSHAVLVADHGGRFSHIGIVTDSAGYIMVVHAVPGEPDYEGDPDRVKMEPAAKFFSTINASLGEVCRPTDSVAARTAADAAMAIYHRRVLFDHQYDDSDTTRMYCTQLVMECYRKAGIELTGPPSHTFNLPGMGCTCWLPSDIYHSPYVQPIYEFK